MYFLALLFLCFFIFLFALYALSRDDFVFLRKGISMEKIFNIAFLTVLISIFFARLFYVVFNPGLEYLNPLIFFIFPYFPGLSLAGGILGGVLSLFYYIARKKITSYRIFDFVAISFLCAYPAGLLISTALDILLNKTNNLWLFIFPAVYILLFILLFKFIFPFHRRGELKDGSLGFLCFIFFSFITLIINIIQGKSRIFLIFGKEEILLIVILAYFIFLFNRQEKFLRKIITIKKQ